MYWQKDGVTTIQCDKCKNQCSTNSADPGKVFWNAGWALNKGRKYMHLCYGCLPKAKQDAMDFVKSHLSF